MMPIKCSVYLAVSLDGYIARPNGDINWLHDPAYQLPDESDFGFGGFLASVDMLVMGRNSFEKVVSFGIGWPYGNTPGIVLSSRSLDIPVEFQSKVEQSNAQPEKLVEQLELEQRSHLYIDGGETIRRFLKAELINEMTLTQFPIILGQGIPLFEPTEQEISLRLLNCKSYSNGFVQSKYQLSYLH